MTPSFLNTEYRTQFQQKVNMLNTMMAVFKPPIAQHFMSPIKQYRMRAEFRLWHEGDDLFYVMFEPNTRKRIKLTNFDVASALINQAMPLLLSFVKKTAILRNKLFQVDYLSTLSNQLLVTLIYHKRLEADWVQAATALREDLLILGLPVSIVGRASKQKICLPTDYVDETLLIHGKPILYRQIENTFTQPNAFININMLEWAIDVTKNSQGDLVELYCGNGNFSLALARNFRSVLATEISKSSVIAAQHNLMSNGIKNVTILRLSAAEFTEAIQGKRQFNRLKGINLTDYDCQTILVDPPRSGLEADTLAMISHYNKIIYVSCNPMTLKENLKVLTQTHAISDMAYFDQFPYTPHMESAVVLTKNELN